MMGDLYVTDLHEILMMRKGHLDTLLLDRWESSQRFGRWILRLALRDYTAGRV